MSEKNENELTELENLFEEIFDKCHELADKLNLDPEKFRRASEELHILFYSAIEDKQGGIYKNVEITKEELAIVRGNLFEQMLKMGLIDPSTFPQA